MYKTSEGFKSSTFEFEESNLQSSAEADWWDPCSDYLLGAFYKQKILLLLHCKNKRKQKKNK